MLRLILLLIATTAYAAPPDVPEKVTARPGQLVRIVAKGDVEIGSLRNFTDDQAFFDELAPRKGERRFVFQCDTPGVYVVGFWTKGETEGVTTTIIVGDGKPNPQPNPDHKPQPDPAPFTMTKLGIYYVEESSDTVAGRGALFADAKLAARIKEKGHRWRVADVNVMGPDGKPPADLVKYLGLTAGKNVPQVFLVDEAGVIRFQGDAPTKAVDLLALLVKFGG